MTAILFVIVAAVLMLIIEIKSPGRCWKKVQGWWFRAFLLNAGQALIVFLSSYTLNVYLAAAPIFHLEAYVSPTVAGIIGYLLITFVFYWWHRARHEIDFLWIGLHQIHHSAQRIELLTTFYKHPLEILIDSIMMSVILYLGLGLSPAAATIATILSGLGELFYHWNIKTPYWLGFLFQRPESHCIHHQKGWHTQNYSDLPLWDMLFGTFNNPRKFEKACGFKDDRETMLKQMLIFKDVNPRI